MSAVLVRLKKPPLRASEPQVLWVSCCCRPGQGGGWAGARTRGRGPAPGETEEEAHSSRGGQERRWPGKRESYSPLNWLARRARAQPGQVSQVKLVFALTHR